MTRPCGRYSEKQISRFVDGALSRQALEQIRQHLDTCSACRDLADQFREVTKTFDELAAQPGRAIDPDRLYRAMQETEKKPAESRTSGFFSRRFRPLLAAASVAALVIIGGIALIDNTIRPDSPSAIVTSIDTEYTAVMIFETPDTHHTIIWYSDT